MRTAPEFTVIIPTRDRPRQLRRALRALAQQSLSRGCFELIVVDDGGAAPLGDVVAAFAGQLDVRLIRQANRGPGAARNAGLREARGLFIAFTDDDCEPLPDWLDKLGTALRQNPDLMVGGYVRNALEDNLCSAASQRIADIVYAFYNADPLNARFFSSNNMAAATSRLRELDGFDESFRIASEDRNLCERWRSAGWHMQYIPEAVVLHSHNLDAWSFCRQHFRYGRGAARFHQERRAMRSSALQHHVAFHAQWRQWLFAPVRERPEWRSVRITALLLLWQAANASGLLWGMLVDRGRTPPQRTCCPD